MFKLFLFYNGAHASFFLYLVLASTHQTLTQPAKQTTLHKSRMNDLSKIWTTLHMWAYVMYYVFEKSHHIWEMHTRNENVGNSWKCQEEAAILTVHPWMHWRSLVGAIEGYAPLAMDSFTKSNLVPTSKAIWFTDLVAASTSILKSK
jgi:hypothetical protein